MNPDDTFEVLIDQIVVNKGSLEDVVPPINPPKEIEDPSDKKPDDWDERAKSLMLLLSNRRLVSKESSSKALCGAK